MSGQFPGHGDDCFLFNAAAVIQQVAIGLFGLDIDSNPSPSGLNQVTAEPGIRDSVNRTSVMRPSVK